jgi:hypothetical protein
MLPIMVGCTAALCRTRCLLSYSVFVVVLVEYFSFHHRDATSSAAKICFHCRHLLAASPVAKTVSQGCSAPSAKSNHRCQWGLPGGDGQGLSSHICLMSSEQTAQLTCDNTAAANKLSKSSTSLFRTAGRGSLGDNLRASSP